MRISMEGDAYGVSRQDATLLPSSPVDFYLHNLLASHLSNKDLSPQEIADASRLAAAAAADAAKVARAVAAEKAAVASKAVVAAKQALDLVASFPRHVTCPTRDMMTKHAPVESLSSEDNDMENPGPSSSPHQVCSQLMSPSGCIGLRECLNPMCTEHAPSKKVCSNGSDRELDDADVLVRNPITRKRGRPKA